MAPVIRPARIDELRRAEELVAQSINDLTVRHGFGAIATSRAPDFQAFCLRDDPRGAWVADDAGEIAGFALSWVCGPLWFLAELFVAPGRQGQRIGGDLLERTFAHAESAGATHRGLITFAFNVVSQGLYVRNGLLPRVPLHLCTADRTATASRLDGPTLRTDPIRLSDGDIDVLRRMDEEVLGVQRAKHHRYLLGDPAMAGVFLRDGGETVGYAYVAGSGHIGPLAVVHAKAMPAAFSTALSVAAATGAKQVSAFVPGPSGALRAAADLDMRFTLPMVVMAARDFGDWSRYLPRNPGFM
jgi:GNAT superfamily N-acetyltransferase